MPRSRFGRALGLSAALSACQPASLYMEGGSPPPARAEYARSNPGAPTYEFVNGLWLSGDRFERRIFYSVDGILRAQPPATVDSVIDLADMYVIPPFGDAHAHQLDSPATLEPARSAYVAEGTFYVQVLSNRRTSADKVRDQFNHPCTLDVAYANGGLTATLGHGFEIAEAKAMGLFKLDEALRTRGEDIKRSRLAENDGYWFIDSLADLDARWPAILAGQPDIIKIDLLFSSDSAPRVAWAPAAWYVHGLKPEVVPAIVQRAHAAGLRVAAHIETAHDFEVAVRSGVDVIAHNAGFGVPAGHEADYLISPAAARLAGERGVVVIPTAAIESDFTRNEPVGLARDQTVQRENLRVLVNAGVKFAIGPDLFGSTAARELEALRDLGVWTGRELLSMWFEATPRSIFPARKIGRLEEGYEASFLALSRNPMESTEAVRAIELRVKQGCVLRWPEAQQGQL
jgi:imidazolonepropionase-like amidohydrolase